MRHGARFDATWYAGIIIGTALGQFQHSALLLQEATALAHMLGDDQAIALADGGMGEDYLWSGRLAEAHNLNDRGLELARRVGPHCFLPIFLFNASWTAMRHGLLVKAAELLDESLAIARRIGDDFALSLPSHCGGPWLCS